MRRRSPLWGKEGVETLDLAGAARLLGRVDVSQVFRSTRFAQAKKLITPHESWTLPCLLAWIIQQKIGDKSCKYFSEGIKQATVKNCLYFLHTGTCKNEIVQLVDSGLDLAAKSKLNQFIAQEINIAVTKSLWNMAMSNTNNKLSTMHFDPVRSSKVKHQLAK